MSRNDERGLIDAILPIYYKEEIEKGLLENSLESLIIDYLKPYKYREDRKNLYIKSYIKVFGYFLNKFFIAYPFILDTIEGRGTIDGFIEMFKKHTENPFRSDCAELYCKRIYS